jgi:tRNA-uridine 2-sulfurtransferase
MKTVYVGMSGGVDSSVAAMLLKKQGYKVVGVYMKNWSQDLPGMPCPWKEDFQDAKRAAVQLGIDFKMYDFETQYRQKVVAYMLDGFKAGITPNPDIMCNQEIKFKLFLETAIEDGADLIATGHYAKVKDGKLFMATDDNKDQTYFLYRVTKEALDKTLFPLGDLTKPQVRELAKQASLVTADKKDSMGICFVGKVGIKDFLQQYVDQSPGQIINQYGEAIGRHDGALFYTIGQRQGLNVGGGLPYYVVDKDMAKNDLHVTTDLQDSRLWSNKIRFSSPHWIDDTPIDRELQIRTRHRANLIKVKKLNKLAPLQNLSAAVDNRIAEHQVFTAGLSSDVWEAELDEEVRALTPGQSAVIYSGDLVLGGGIVV